MDMRKIETHQERGVNLAAAITRLQLTYARDIANAAFPDKQEDVPLITAIMQALATNYAAVVTGKVG